MDTLQQTIIELWHISRTALAGSIPSRYDRMIYIKNELNKHYPQLITRFTPKYLWLEIQDTIN